MRSPVLFGACVAAMKDAVALPVTVKCRLGVDEQDPEAALDALADAVLAGGADAIWVHARKAWLKGLSAKENRDVPPLDYGRVHRLKQRLQGTFVGINGGIHRLDEAAGHLHLLDGVMLGRAAYQNPAILAEVDHRFYGDPNPPTDPGAAVEAMLPYIEREVTAGARLPQITRHMLGLFHGLPGARRWRQMLSVAATRPGAGPEVIRAALAAIEEQANERPAVAA